ncbi:MAG: enoyl-CoA hydratase, partial [Actinomycetales bacterium]
MESSSDATTTAATAQPGAPVDDTILLSRHGAVALVTLNRPDRLNAFTDEMELRYVRLLRELDDDESVRVIVVTGAGRGFCAGVDTGALKDIGSPDFTVDIATADRISPTRLRKPLIAAVNGPAAGMGLMHATYCDIRFASPAARFTTAFVRRGLAGEYGATWILPRLVGPAVAADLLLSGRVVDAAEAERMGLVNAVAPQETSVVDFALEYAADLAENCSPHAVALTKTMLHDHAHMSFDRAVDASVAV